MDTTHNHLLLSISYDTDWNRIRTLGTILFKPEIDLNRTEESDKKKPDKLSKYQECPSVKFNYRTPLFPHLFNDSSPTSTQTDFRG